MAVKAQFIAGQWQPGSGATMSKLAPEDQSLLWQAASAGATTSRRPAPRRARVLSLVAPPAGRAY
jgi:hypothetical protein